MHMDWLAARAANSHSAARDIRPSDRAAGCGALQASGDGVWRLLRPALKVGDAVTSYAGLGAASARVAWLLRARGVNPGDRVRIMLPNVPQFAVVYHGILRARGVVVPMNVLLKQREVAFHLGDEEARLVFAWPGFVDAAPPAPRPGRRPPVPLGPA
jgi:acyl-CoA synthetase (AMP-forming)/AMP-acid ligase II